MPRKTTIPNKNPQTAVEVAVAIGNIQTTLDFMQGSLEDIVESLRTYNQRHEALRNKVQNIETQAYELKLQLSDMVKDHRVNTDFRKNSIFMFKLVKWGLPPQIIITTILAILSAINLT